MAGTNIALAMVYVNMFCDVLGQKVVDLVESGMFPALVASQGGVLVMALLRVAFAICYLLYIRTPDDFGGVDDVMSYVAVAVFVVSAGYVTSTGYSTAARSVRVADRKVAVSLCSTAVFIGLYPAFLSAYLLYKDDVLV